MFSSIQAFISRHRRKFIFGSAFIGGAILLSNYGKKILKERQERETKELFERNRKQQHFESIEGLCSHTALNIMPTLRNSIMQALDTEELINQLRDKVSDKITCWEQLKIRSFARVIALVYAASVLMVALRIQLNLIGGYTFRDLADEKKQFTNSMHRKYLSFCDYFNDAGVKKLCRLVTEKVVLFLQGKSLRAEMKLYDIENIFSLVQASMEEDPRNPCKTMTDYVLPEQFRDESFSTDNEAFDQVVKDTKDLFESSEVSYSISYCVDHGKMVLVETLKEFFRAKSKNTSINKSNELVEFHRASDKEALLNFSSLNGGEIYVDFSKISIQMAKVIPIVNGLIQNSKNDLTEKWMLELIMMERLKILGANVYETFSSKYENTT